MLEGHIVKARGSFRAPRPLIGLLLSVAVGASLAALPAASDAAGSTSIRSLPAPQVEAVLAKTPLSTLEAGALAELLGGLPALGGVEAKALEQSLEETIESLAAKGDTLEGLLSSEEAATILAGKLEEALGPILGKLLETALGGNPVTQLEAALGTTSPQQVLGELLAGSGAPQTLAEQVLGAIEPAAVEALLGAALGAEPFVRMTAGELAANAGTTVQGLAEGLGANPAALTGSALALAKPLSGNLTLGLLDGAEGLTLGLLERVSEETKEALGGGGGTGGGSGGGGSGGTGGPGGSSPGTTVLILGSSPLAPAPAGPLPAAGKLEVLGHHVHGHRASVLVQVPGAGVLSASARGIRRIRREASHPERVTLHLALTGAGVAALRHGRRARVTLRVSFQSVAGAASKAGVVLYFR